MLIGSSFEKSPAERAWQLCADKLGDRVRDIWLDKVKQGVHNWEETFFEDPAALVGLREEGFKGLVGIDYIFKWWGAVDSEELAGELDVIWKVVDDDVKIGIDCYKSWIKLAERDFILGLYKDERDKRAANREAFRDAFAQWKDTYQTLK